MLRSMFAGVAGLRNHQVKMDVVANNISNVNTFGYKTSRATFVEMYNQTLAPAAAPSASGSTGGTNPKQIGLGVTTAAIDVIHTNGSTQTTDRTLDLMIDGEGFFSVTAGEETMYTRAGNMYLDPHGYLVTGSGMFVQGIMLLSDSELPESTEEAVMEHLTSDENIIWGAGKEDEGQLEELSSPEGGILPMNVTGEEGRETRDSIVGRIIIPTAYKSLAIDSTGLISAMDENGVNVKVAVLATTTFINPSGLERAGNSLYRESANSGSPRIALPDTDVNGPVKSGALEMSNVDLSREFTDMIITQRGFQANSRIITVSDSLLEELVNLKR